MNDFPIFPILFAGAILAVVLTLAIVGGRLERKRREALAATAARLGFTFAPGQDRNLAERFSEFRGLGTGDNHYAFSIIEGALRERPLLAFDYHYETHSTDSKGGRSTTHHYLHVISVRLEREFPPLFIGPESVLSKIAQAFGYDDIDFESHEFSRRFCVRSTDRKFAYDVCNTQMMEFLLDHPDLQLELKGDLLVSVFESKMDPGLIESEIELVCSVRERMPDYLFAAA